MFLLRKLLEFGKPACFGELPRTRASFSQRLTQEPPESVGRHASLRAQKRRLSERRSLSTQAFQQQWVGHGGTGRRYLSDIARRRERSTIDITEHAGSAANAVAASALVTAQTTHWLLENPASFHTRLIENPALSLD